MKSFLMKKYFIFIYILHKHYLLLGFFYIYLNKKFSFVSLCVCICGGISILISTKLSWVSILFLLRVRGSVAVWKHLPFIFIPCGGFHYEWEPRAALELSSAPLVQCRRAQWGRRSQRAVNIITQRGSALTDTTWRILRVNFALSATKTHVTAMPMTNDFFKICFCLLIVWD